MMRTAKRQQPSQQLQYPMPDASRQGYTSMRVDSSGRAMALITSKEQNRLFIMDTVVAVLNLLSAIVLFVIVDHRWTYSVYTSIPNASVRPGSGPLGSVLYDPNWRVERPHFMFEMPVGYWAPIAMALGALANLALLARSFEERPELLQNDVVYRMRVRSVWWAFGEALLSTQVAELVGINDAVTLLLIFAIATIHVWVIYQFLKGALREGRYRSPLQELAVVLSIMATMAHWVYTMQHAVDGGDPVWVGFVFAIFVVMFFAMTASTLVYVKHETVFHREVYYTCIMTLSLQAIAWVTYVGLDDQWKI